MAITTAKATADGTASAGSTFTLTTGLANAFNRCISTLTQPAFA